MGLFDDLTSKAGEMLGGLGGGQSNIISAVMNLLGGGQFNGISGLVDTFKEKGLGNIVSSWVGTGENLPISGAQVKKVFGEDKINQFAADAGIPEGEAQNKIAEVLPGIVDKLTPGGNIPEGNIVSKGLDFLKSL